MTIHWSKWLEFDIVFVVWMEEGIFPSLKANNNNSFLEEERRLAYVAVTRAKEKLYLLSTKNRMIYWEFQTNKSSRFIKEISSNLLNKVDISYWSRFINNFENKKKSSWVNSPSWANF